MKEHDVCRGSSLFFEINQKLRLFSFLEKSMFNISEYLFIRIALSSATVLSVGILKYFSSVAARLS